jgi:glycine/D-amino acid oxidase-like deaminating enzyme/nitrite reductase/ring-hydroxylating ferredoxin subunit
MPSARATSPWTDSPLTEPGPLREDLRTDVCVVGAGIAGLSTAYALASEGKRVVVLDAGPLAGGETSRTTAHLTNAIDDRFVEIERLHGPEGARICAESHATAIDAIERTARAEGIDCDFARVDGYLFGGGDTPRVSLDEELEAARRAGLTRVEKVSRAPLASFDTGPCLRFPAQARFHPLAYLRGLSEALAGRGARLFDSTRVLDVEDGDPVRIVTEGGPVVTADHVVVATNSPINDRFAIHTKQAPYRTYAIAAELPRGSVTDALYWDTLEPYHYVRLAPGAKPGSELLIVGGEDRRPGDEDDHEGRFDALERWMDERFPGRGQVAFRWSGQVMEPADGVAFIGFNPGGENVYVVSGDSGQGMTHGTIAAILVTDLVTGRENAWSRLYDPSRITLGALGRFLEHGASVVASLAAWIGAGDVGSVDEIAPGAGAVVRRGAKLVAAYRDAGGRLHERSAACTHLGCVVAWNPVAESWDCRCHGSRFDPYGNVLAGPAVAELKPVDG